jgi:branched-chain amino acid transport system permease protein
VAVRSAAPLVIAGVLAVLMQLFVRHAVGDYWANIILFIGINIVLAVSLQIVNGFAGQFSIGHAGFMAVGGYASACIVYYTSLSRGLNMYQHHGGVLSGMKAVRVAEDQTFWQVWGEQLASTPIFTGMDGVYLLALIAGGVVAAGMGFLVGLPSLRLRGDYLAIVTLGFGEIVRVLIQQTLPLARTAEAADALPWYKVPVSVGGALGFDGVPSYTGLFWTTLFAGVTIIFAKRLKQSTHGRAMLSVREDEIASEAMGVNTTRAKLTAFVLSAFFAGIAGGLAAHTLGFGLSAETSGFMKSFDIIIMVVLGGLGSVSGAALAAIIVTMLPEWLRPISEYRMVVFALALILMMIFRPKGLLGTREIWEIGPWARWFRRKGPTP